VTAINACAASHRISAVIASSFASFLPSRPALYLDNTCWKNDDPQFSCLARSEGEATIDPVVYRLCGVPRAAERGEAGAW
jgi:hypothetical protein